MHTVLQEKDPLRHKFLTQAIVLYSEVLKSKSALCVEYKELILQNYSLDHYFSTGMSRQFSPEFLHELLNHYDKLTTLHVSTHDLIKAGPLIYAASVSRLCLHVP